MRRVFTFVLRALILVVVFLAVVPYRDALRDSRPPDDSAQDHRPRAESG